MVVIELVNVVGSGDLEREIDLDPLSDDLRDFDEIGELGNRDTPPGLSIQLKDEKGNIVLFTSGKYNIMGCGTEAGLTSLNASFMEILHALGVINSEADITPKISNYVYTVDLEKRIDLPVLYSQLGDRAQYEPEQNPFLVYRPEAIDCVMTISSNGKSVANTGTGIDPVKRAVLRLSDYIEINYDSAECS